MTERLKVEGISRNFGGIVVASDINLTLHEGERVALIGPNGAGKTTLINLITGLLKPSSGRIYLDGHDITKLTDTARVQRGLVRSFQITRLFPSLTVAEHASLTILQQRGKIGGLFQKASDVAGIRDQSYRFLSDLGLADVADRKVSDIDYGQQRLVELLVATALQPKVLLLDEPAAGVPHANTAKIFQSIAKLPQNIAVLMIDHDMDLVFKFASRIIVLAAGRIIADGAPSEIVRNNAVRESYLGDYGA